MNMPTFHWRPLLLRLGRALIRLSLDKSLRNDLQRVFWRVDGQMPKLLASDGPGAVTRFIGDAIAEATGQPATGQRVEAVVALYNPIAAAVRNLQR